MQTRSLPDRIRHALMFEGLGLAIFIPLAAVVFDQPAGHMGWSRHGQLDPGGDRRLHLDPRLSQGLDRRGPVPRLFPGRRRIGPLSERLDRHRMI
ncbi:hypothetical protein DPM13_12545 [Paracoccus mutanolyticus]|uniref:Chlorhexidine efflux transporter domain-containing protein n=1 Tax=Paracoccus mutanolyticus TaxID=1499308 RepID=A0ABN5M995_9RHOB|nr:hypothetical protein DPM13_12545 [Paracoccus mutanolyticus]